jgi:hypothetical protein
MKKGSAFADPSVFLPNKTRSEIFVSDLLAAGIGVGNAANLQERSRAVGHADTDQITNVI